ncbi:MAG TPA: hypothetical protein VII63_04325 [Caulobacteraceae bacterium]
MAHREVDLDERGLAYVLEHLRGVNILCEGLARAVEASRGRVFTLIPAQSDVTAVYDFGRGGLLAENFEFSRAVSLGPGQGSLMPVASLLNLRASMTLEALTAHRGAVCLCDDFNPKWPEEADLASTTVFGVGKETYHLLTAQSGFDTIADTLGWTDTVWHGVAAICTKALNMPPCREVTEADLLACASSVTEMSCTAYDREGFVVWRLSDR